MRSAAVCYLALGGYPVDVVEVPSESDHSDTDQGEGVGHETDYIAGEQHILLVVQQN